MQAVASLPKGALVLPGYDFDLPTSVWEAVGEDAGDHPQAMLGKLVRRLGLSHQDVRPWSDHGPHAPERNKLISLALRPAPVTDQWRREGPALGDLNQATENVTLMVAPGQREEAVAVALRLRAALASPARGPRAGCHRVNAAG